MPSNTIKIPHISPPWPGVGGGVGISIDKCIMHGGISVGGSGWRGRGGERRRYESYLCSYQYIGMGFPRDFVASSVKLYVPKPLYQIEVYTACYQTIPRN